MKLCSWLLIIYFLAVGCASKFGKLTRRYKKASESSVAIKEYIAVDGYFFEPDQQKKESKPLKSLADFPYRVQQDIVKGFRHYDKTSADFIKSLATPLSNKPPEPDEPFIDDRTMFNKRLVLSIRNKSYFPADRIWKIFITLKMTDTPPIRFSNTNTIVSDFEIVDVGKLGYTDNTNFSTTLSANSGISGTIGNDDTNSSSATASDTVSRGLRNTVGSNETKRTNQTTVENKLGATVAYGRDVAVSEEVLLKQRRVKLTGFVKERSLSLYQESTSGIDLSGNIIADVELSLLNVNVNDAATAKVFVFSKLMTGTSFTDPSGIEAKEIAVVYPAVSKNVECKIIFEGVVRRVLKRAKTISEADDKVAFYHGEASDDGDPILILSTREMTPSFWHISKGGGQVLRIKSLSSLATDLKFRDYEDARNFITWLKSKAAQIVAAKGKIGPNHELVLGTMTDADILNCTVEIVR